MQKEEQVSFLAEKIRQADAVLIGGGSGLSSAAGYNHYHWLPYMEECLQDFKEWYAPTGQPYYDLCDIVAEKEVFVLTTNIDMQFERIFRKKGFAIIKVTSAIFNAVSLAMIKFIPM